MKWEDIYKVWKWEMCKFPVLSAQKYCLKTEISKPRFGPCYSFNWIEKEREKESMEYEAAPVFARKYGYWHSNSREFFPEFYIPMELFWEDKKLSVSALVKLAALNAAVVIGNYTPVEYKKI